MLHQLAEAGHTSIAKQPSAGTASQLGTSRVASQSLLARAAVRLLDIAVASAILLLTGPLLLTIAVWTKLDSPGPALFRHTRIGKNRRRSDGSGYRGQNRRTTHGYGQPFSLFKFRTMVVDARERFPELYAYEYLPDELHSMPIKVLVGTKMAARLDPSGEAPIGELPSDPRITRVGRWLRRTSLDELPNLINVLKGDMHLVGPRPDIVENIRYYESQHLAKLDVRPGVTGLAQVQGRGNLSFHATNEWDINYVENRSLWFDVRILLKTIRVWIGGVGAF